MVAPYWFGLLVDYDEKTVLQDHPKNSKEYKKAMNMGQLCVWWHQVNPDTGRPGYAKSD
jgi:hypothetical protein